jgi:hypothetical protein
MELLDPGNHSNDKTQRQRINPLALTHKNQETLEGLLEFFAAP